jgi:predicted ATPase
LPQLLAAKAAQFRLNAELAIGKEAYRYQVAVQINPASGSLSIGDEYLTAVGKSGEAKGIAAIEQVEGRLRVRRKSESGRPRYDSLGQNYAVLSDARLGAPQYPMVEKVRAELAGWRVYYLDPRVAMRSARPPEAVADIGLLGEHLAPFLFRLRAEAGKDFGAVVRTLRTLIPAVESVDVDLDPKRGTLDITVVQDGTSYSSRIVSEGTLRVLALCAIAANPWGGTLVGFEEPENGVHPRRLELIAKLLWNLAHAPGARERQLVVTTHSPLFCDALLRLQRSQGGDFALLNVQRRAGATLVVPFATTGPLFDDDEIAKALADPVEDALFEKLLRRGLIDA